MTDEIQSPTKSIHNRVDCDKKITIKVDVIVPVHNASDTLETTLFSAFHQTIPTHLEAILSPYQFDVAVCCYNDSSTDESLSILHQIKIKHEQQQNEVIMKKSLPCRILIGSNPKNSPSRGAGYARNQAVLLRTKEEYGSKQKDNYSSVESYHFLCLLDSDDRMKSSRIAEQVAYFISLQSSSLSSEFLNKSSNESTGTSTRLESNVKDITNNINILDTVLLGTTFERDPPDSTWHYTNWANTQLTNQRLFLEQFREVTILQPTWMMTKSRFIQIGGYIEAPIDMTSLSSSDLSSPPPSSSSSSKTITLSSIPIPNKITNNHEIEHSRKQPSYQLIHPQYDTAQTLRLAEDLRFFHAHLSIPVPFNTNQISSQNMETSQNHTGNTSSSLLSLPRRNENSGTLHLLRTKEPLVIYTHRIGQSQSSNTSRTLLLQLRVKAFEDAILKPYRYPNDNILQSSNYLVSQPKDEAYQAISHINKSFHSTNNHKRKRMDIQQSPLLKQINPKYPPSWNKFVIWGAGRDGKQFLKTLDPQYQKNVVCFVDVDWKKIHHVKYYVYKEMNIKIPILHFSVLAKDKKVRKRWYLEELVQKKTLPKQKQKQKQQQQQSYPMKVESVNHITQNMNKTNNFIPFGKITKGKQPFNLDSKKDNCITPLCKDTCQNEQKIAKVENNHVDNDNEQSDNPIDMNEIEKYIKVKYIDGVPLTSLPVIVCVAMYRTNGVLEQNVASIGRKEGYDLWHFS